MRVMQIVSGLGRHGAPLQALLLGKLLARAGHEVTFVCRDEAYGERLIDDDRIEVIQSSLRRWPARELRRIRDVAQSSGVDIVHTHMSSAHMFGVLMRRFFGLGIPVVATAHNRQFQPHWRFNDFIIANSQATFHYHRRWNLVPRSRMEVIYYPLELSPFDELPDDEVTRFRTEEGDGAELVIGCVGDVVKRKAQIDLIAAMPRVLRSFPDLRLLLAGVDTSDYAEQARQTVSRMELDKYVRFLGSIRNVPTMMRALDLCIACPLEEAFGLTALEAMAARCPFITTRTGGLTESVVDGVTGLVVPARPRRRVTDALADAIISLLADPSRRSRFGEAGRKRVLDHFSPATYLARVEAVYEHCIQRLQTSAAA